MEQIVRIRMKAIIFAGGVGTRLWPLSRKSSPKQFEKVIGDKSTMQLAVERLLPDFSWKDIYIATSRQYLPIVNNQLPKINTHNLIGEPETKDVGPAVGVAMALLMKEYRDTPVLILWSDHLIKNDGLFRRIIQTCGKLINKNKKKIIFIGQKPRFASQNLGWIKFGENVSSLDDIKIYSFENFYYRPELSVAQKFYKDGHYCWNVGYFVTTPAFLWSLYQKYQPEIFDNLKKIKDSKDTSSFQTQLNKLYSMMPKISFDNAILEHINSQDALVISQDLGWSDVGAWEALKEALQTSPDQNIIQGKVAVTDCRDSLVYNYTDKMVVTIDLNGFLVINTHDVILICHKNSVPKIKKFVESLRNSENDHLI